MILDENSGATISIAVHKAGPVSGWMGHNLLLRVQRYLLCADAKKSKNMSLPEKNSFEQCLDAVRSATFEPSSIHVAGSIPEKFYSSSCSSSKTSPPLFRWPDVHPVSHSDTQQILKNIFGSGGLLSEKQQQHNDDAKFVMVPKITFEKTSYSFNKNDIHKNNNNNKDEASVTGNLTILNRTNEITCRAFLADARCSAESKSEEGGTTNNIVFQCPIDTRRWNIPVVSVFGLLSTEPDVMVEVAVPMNKIL
jgi:hypothetical protein